jgi:hypothetical protein
MSSKPEPVQSITDRAEKSTRPVKAETIATEIAEQLGEQNIAFIYRDRVLSQRTRQYELHATAYPRTVEILHTLLGIELKISNRRLLCPDLATARYLAVFARLGCDVIAIPYDITQISRLADELESSWQRMMLLVEHFTVDRSDRLRASVRRRLLDQTRTTILHLGAGTRFPQFNQKTRQRRR